MQIWEKLPRASIIASSDLLSERGTCPPSPSRSGRGKINALVSRGAIERVQGGNAARYRGFSHAS